MTATQFATAYFDEALFDLPTVIERASEDLVNIDFDTLVGTGFSGAIVIPTLALALDKKYVLIRKETDDSHHGKGRLVGSLGERWLFVDDFICSGQTRARVEAKIADAARIAERTTEFVGSYLYVNALRGYGSTAFRPAEGDYR